MANETRDGNGSSSNWTDPSNVNSDDGVDATLTCSNLFDGSPLNCYDSGGIVSTIDNFTITGQIGWVRGYAKVRRIDSAGSGGDMTRLYMYFNDGGGYCAGHNVGTVGTSYVTRSTICTHHAWTSTTIQNMQIKVQADLRADGNSSVRAGVDYIYANVANPVAPSAPADPSIVADGTDSVTVSSNTPSSGGDTITNVEHQISTSSTFASGITTWTKGSAPTNPQTHQFTGLSSGQIYYARARYYNNYAGWGDYNAYPYNSDTTWTLPAAPADPTISATAVKTMSVSSPNPTSGSPYDNVEIKISTSITFASGNITYTKGSAPTDPQTHDFTSTDGVTDGTLYYARARYHNGAGWGDYNASPYNSATSWDVSTPPTWAVPAFTGQGSSSIAFDWITPSSDGGTSITEYWYAWMIDGGSFAVIDTNSTNTSAVKSALSDGEKYWFKVLARNAVGSSPYSSTKFRWTLCLNPSAPTVTANAIKTLRIQHADDVTGQDKWRVMRASAWDGSYIEVHLSSAGGGALDWSDTGLNDGETWFYKLYAVNEDGNNSILGFYASGTTWDIPDIQDLVSATTPNGSMIRITRNASYPDGNGDPVDSWEVWRSSTSGGTYSLIQDGITATTYDDWSVDGGETWYYKAKFTNLVGDSAISTNNVNATVTYVGISLNSDSAVKVFDISISKISDSRVQIIDNTISLLSDTLVKILQNIQLNSDATVKVSNLTISLISDSKVIVPRADWQPSMTFDKYEFNTVDTDITANEQDITLDEPDGLKTIQTIHIDPYEDTLINADTHEFFYSASQGSGTADYQQKTLANGFFEYDGGTETYDQLTRARPIGMSDRPVWNGGNVSYSIDTEGDWAGSGSELVIISSPYSNSGSSWTPPSGSGTNVLDVPNTHNGSMIVVNDFSDWDSNVYHGFHQWLPIQVVVGHTLEMAGFDFISGTYSDNKIDLYGNTSTDYWIDFKTYHEYAKEWEWVSGSTGLNSGTITPSEETWQFIRNLDLINFVAGGTYSYQLRLYGSNSGSMFDLTFGEALRTIDVDVHIT